MLEAYISQTLVIFAFTDVHSHFRNLANFAFLTWQISYIIQGYVIFLIVEIPFDIKKIFCRKLIGHMLKCTYSQFSLIM